MNSETLIDDGYTLSDNLSTFTEGSCLLTDESTSEDDIQSNSYNPVHSSGSKDTGAGARSIIIKIDNLPPDKNWKQIKYMLGGIIHHSNILQLRLLPPVKSIVPPFMTSQSCIVILNESLEGDSILNLLGSINSYEWDNYELHAYILPPISNVTPFKAPILPSMNYPSPRFPNDFGTENAGDMGGKVDIDPRSDANQSIPMAIYPGNVPTQGPLGFSYPPPASFSQIPQGNQMTSSKNPKTSDDLNMEGVPTDQRAITKPPTFLDPQFSPMYAPYPVHPNFPTMGYHQTLPLPPFGHGPLMSPILSNGDMMGFQPFSPYYSVLQPPLNNLPGDGPSYARTPYGRQTFNPFKQAKNLKNIFNEQNFRKQMTSRGMWQLKLSNFPPYIIPDSLKERALEDDEESGTGNGKEEGKTVIETDLTTRYGKLRWTVLKDFIKLKCPKLLHLQNSGSISVTGRDSTREFYVGVYEEEKRNCIVKMDGMAYDAVGVFFSAIVGFHSKKLFDLCYKSLEGQEYSMGYILKIEKLPLS